MTKNSAKPDGLEHGEQVGHPEEIEHWHEQARLIGEEDWQSWLLKFLTNVWFWIGAPIGFSLGIVAGGITVSYFFLS